MNDYDYKKMMIDFETETRHKKIINGIRNKWRIASSKYYEKIKSIKVENKKADKKKQIDFKKRYKAKELSIKNQLELNKLEKFEEKNKRAEFLKKRMKMLKKTWKDFIKNWKKKDLRWKKIP